jgi:hypothetical protein
MPTHTFKQNKPSLGIGRTSKETMNIGFMKMAVRTGRILDVANSQIRV